MRCQAPPAKILTRFVRYARGSELAYKLLQQCNADVMQLMVVTVVFQGCVGATVNPLE